MKTGGQVRKDAPAPSEAVREVLDFRAGFYEARQRRYEDGENKIDEQNMPEYLDYYERAAATTKDNSFVRGFLAGLKYRFGDYVEEILTLEPVRFVPTKIEHFEDRRARWEIEKAKIENVLGITLPIHPTITATEEGGLIITSPPGEGLTQEFLSDGTYYRTINLTELYNPEPDRPYLNTGREKQEPKFDPAAVKKARDIILNREPY